MGSTILGSSCLTDTNFDFAEGGSELESEFTVEPRKDKFP